MAKRNLIGHISLSLSLSLVPYSSLNIFLCPLAILLIRALIAGSTPLPPLANHCVSDCDRNHQYHIVHHNSIISILTSWGGDAKGCRLRPPCRCSCCSCFIAMAKPPPNGQARSAGPMDNRWTGPQVLELKADKPHVIITFTPNSKKALICESCNLETMRSESNFRESDATRMQWR